MVSDGEIYVCLPLKSVLSANDTKIGNRKDSILSLIKLRLQYLAMILHALNICLCLRLRSTIRTHTRGVDVPVAEDGRRHIKSNVNCFFVLLRLFVCVMSLF